MKTNFSWALAALALTFGLSHQFATSNAIETREDYAALHISPH